ncbi:alpha/beta fold hydrolase [Microbacterium sp. NPDC077663]|uniref:alpha/beta fold hydrolase n=1 Tax=Microbacterium sp. NPDC077663 TaxID=3364189 RepID=UPI0037C53C30
MRGPDDCKMASTARTRLTTDAETAGLRAVQVSTAIGVVSARVGVRRSPVATVLLHGAAGSWTTWTPLLREAELSGRPVPNVVALDLPGWGESAPPPGGVDIARTAMAVLEVVRQLGYRRWILVGHSLGGALALDIAARTPELTDTVILVSPSGAAVFDAVRRPVRGGRRLPAFAGMLLAMRFLRSLGGAAPGLLRVLEREGLLRVLSSPLFAAPRDIDPTVIRALAAEIRPASFVAAARAAAAYDESSWRGIRCPVRAVGGDRDVFVGAADEAALSALIADFAETTIPGVGHFAAVERPAAVLALIDRAFAAQPTL